MSLAEITGLCSEKGELMRPPMFSILTCSASFFLESFLAYMHWEMRLLTQVYSGVPGW